MNIEKKTCIFVRTKTHKLRVKIISPQNGYSVNNVIPSRFRVLQWSHHLFLIKIENCEKSRKNLSIQLKFDYTVGQKKKFKQKLYGFWF